MFSCSDLHLNLSRSLGVHNFWYVGCPYFFISISGIFEIAQAFSHAFWGFKKIA
jgi:hypothetical protein